MSSMGNPFEDDCPELLAMDSRNCATEAVIATVRGIKTLGLTQYQAYVADVIVAKTTSLMHHRSKGTLCYHSSGNHLRFQPKVSNKHLA